MKPVAIIISPLPGWATKAKGPIPAKAEARSPKSENPQSENPNINNPKIKKYLTIKKAPI